MSNEEQREREFGPNQWLIDEMFRTFRSNPEAVSPSWRDFFSDYRPAAGRVAPPPPMPSPTPAPVLEPSSRPEAVTSPANATLLIGPAKKLAENMQASVSVPTATSVRTMPVKLLEENRGILNQHLAESSGGKVSFTHILAWAIVKTLQALPGMRNIYLERPDGAYRVLPEHINLGVAVDVTRKDGSRGLVVPSIKAAEQLEFAIFFAAYNELLRKAQKGQLTPEDFADTNASLTNPGMLGTTQSVPRLMAGQSLIVATGSIAYPPEYQYADEHAIAHIGISKIITLTSTYDHRIIQGADSAAFLAYLADLLAGGHTFYEGIFASLDVPHEPIRIARDVNPYFSERGADALLEKQAAVLALVNMFRVRGHLVAHTNPLGKEIPTHPELELSRYGLTIWDLDREFYTAGLGGTTRARLRDILENLRTAYCGTLAIEYMHIQEADQKAWIQQHVEGIAPESWVDADEKRRIINCLNGAEAFERFLHTKYLGHKRFSLEGAESLIPMLDRLLISAISGGVNQVVMGMAHRGRLNVLANILGRSYEKIFRGFEGSLDPNSREGSGDVKYHLGATGDFVAPDGRKAHLILASNPSHLEAVDPVVEGMARALQDAVGDSAREQVLPVLIHGDAAFAGQGVVAETLNMSALSGYRTGGTVHIVVNNGIGFTTAPADARSSVYATDVAKMVQAPIFHVNGDDPEAAVRVIDIAFAFRNQFKKDVVIDLVGYRRHGHNEADEPAYTQPLMYALIQDHRSVRKLYTERLVNRGDLSVDEAEAVLADFQKRLESSFAATKESVPPEIHIMTGAGEIEPPPSPAPALSKEMLQDILNTLAHTPEGFDVHPKLAKQLASRTQALEANAVDWGVAEALAFGSLLVEGVPIRLSGQDSRRGTFSHRHAVLIDHTTGAAFSPLQQLGGEKTPFMVFDSLLSEYAVLGFEYGYSVMRPEALVLWEAQFGDFVNGAQIIIDQFLAAAEEKWDQHSKLTLLLPHGFEGQGPEHSSGRIERFLQLSTGANLQVVVPSTAAQYFHLIRRQGHLTHSKPLVIFTPKSLLRAPIARSTAADLTATIFQTVLADPHASGDAELLLLCSGKIAYDLFDARDKVAHQSTAIYRVEQLTPFPVEELRVIVAAMPKLRAVRWVQEEPRNMGAWHYVSEHLRELLDDLPLAYVGRHSSGSPATGSARLHQAEQEHLVSEAFQSL